MMSIIAGSVVGTVVRGEPRYVVDQCLRPDIANLARQIAITHISSSYAGPQLAMQVHLGLRRGAMAAANRFLEDGGLGAGGGALAGMLIRGQ